MLLRLFTPIVNTFLKLLLYNALRAELLFQLACLFGVLFGRKYEINTAKYGASGLLLKSKAKPSLKPYGERGWLVVSESYWEWHGHKEIAVFILFDGLAEYGSESISSCCFERYSSCKAKAIFH